MLAIIVPVLNRPNNIAPLMASFAATTPGRLLFVVNEDDDAELAALRKAGADYIAVPPARRSWACKINDGFRATTQPWIFTGADDIEFRSGWLSNALKWANDRTGVIGTNDLWNPRVMCGDHSTHSLVRRSYVEELGTVDQPGVVLHEGYGHGYADDELVQTAKARHRYVHAFDAIVEHKRPKTRDAEDETYRLGRKLDQDGRRIYQRRRQLWKAGKLGRPSPSTKRATVVTATYGGYDAQLHGQVAQDLDVDWVCFTDDPHLEPPSPWRVELVDATSPEGVMAAFFHKAMPQVEGPDVVWIDASMEVTSPKFVRHALDSRRDGVAAFAHPRRDCVYAEGLAVLGAESQGGKYDAGRVTAQMAEYRKAGYPEGLGLFALGSMAWDTDIAGDLGAAWWAEQGRWRTIDQMAFPVVCWRLGITPGVFPAPQIESRYGRHGRYLGNRWLRIHPHRVRPEVAV